MLTIYIKSNKLFNHQTNKFITVKEQTLYMEHSLNTIAKWESIHHVSFFDEFNSKKQDITNEKLLSYIKCMILNKYDDNCLYFLSLENYKNIEEYMANPMSALKTKQKKGGVYASITAEEIYYRMVALQIPFTCEHWHINRLFKLIETCSFYQSQSMDTQKKKINYRDRRKLNEQRLEKLGTNG